MNEYLISQHSTIKLKGDIKTTHVTMSTGRVIDKLVAWAIILNNYCTDADDNRKGA